MVLGLIGNPSHVRFLRESARDVGLNIDPDLQLDDRVVMSGNPQQVKKYLQEGHRLGLNVEYYTEIPFLDKRVYPTSWRDFGLIPGQDPTYEDSQIKVDFLEEKVYKQGNPVDIDGLEFRTLCTLVRSEGSFLNLDDLSFRTGHEFSIQSLRVRISNIRKVIEEDPRNPKLIILKRPGNYMYQSPQPYQPDSTALTKT